MLAGGMLEKKITAGNNDLQYPFNLNKVCPCLLKFNLSKSSV